MSTENDAKIKHFSTYNDLVKATSDAYKAHLATRKAFADVCKSGEDLDKLDKAMALFGELSSFLGVIGAVAAVFDIFQENPTQEIAQEMGQISQQITEMNLDLSEQLNQVKDLVKFESLHTTLSNTIMTVRAYTPQYNTLIYQLQEISKNKDLTSDQLSVSKMVMTGAWQTFMEANPKDLIGVFSNFQTITLNPIPPDTTYIDALNTESYGSVSAAFNAYSQVKTNMTQAMNLYATWILFNLFTHTQIELLYGKTVGAQLSQDFTNAINACNTLTNEQFGGAAAVVNKLYTNLTDCANNVGTNFVDNISSYLTNPTNLVTDIQALSNNIAAVLEEAYPTWIWTVFIADGNEYLLTSGNKKDTSTTAQNIWKGVKIGDKPYDIIVAGGFKQYNTPKPITLTFDPSTDDSFMSLLNDINGNIKGMNNLLMETLEKHYPHYFIWVQTTWSMAGIEFRFWQSTNASKAPATIYKQLDVGSGNVPNYVLFKVETEASSGADASSAS